MSYEGPGLYEHYKGSQYEVLGLGCEEATLTPIVIYKPVGKLMPTDMGLEVEVSFWTRPLENFNENVTLPGVRDTHPDVVVARFTFVQDLLP